MEFQQYVFQKKCWDSLTDEERTIIQEEFDKGAEDNLTETVKLEDEYAQKIKKIMELLSMKLMQKHSIKQLHQFMINSLNGLWYL